MYDKYRKYHDNPVFIVRCRPPLIAREENPMGAFYGACWGLG
jgi:hypothetical protein